MTKAKSNDEEPPSWSLWTASSYAVVMLLIGLPLWWKTTTVHRAPLPYDEMLSLHGFLTDSLRIEVKVYLKGFDASDREEEDLNKGGGTGLLDIKYYFQETSEDEEKVIRENHDLYDVDRQFCNNDLPNDLNIFVVNRTGFLKEFGERVVIGNCRGIYYVSESPRPNLKLISKVVNTLTMSSSKADEAELELPLSAGYDVLLSLLVPEPELFDATWDIQNGIKEFIQPLLRRLKKFGEFSIRSQILYYVKLNVYPKLNKETESYIVSYDQLPVVINPVESKLTSFVSQNPVLNFLVYVSPCAVNPMQLVNDDGSFILSNGFFVPQWGGIQVYNGPCNSPSRNHTIPHDVSIRSIMDVIIPQFRALLGVPLLAGDEFTLLDIRRSALRDWELDILLRRRLERILFTSANTLMSLGNLLDQITNIVVRDEVGEEVERSVNALKVSYSQASSGNLVAALHQATVSYKSSEIAFHHPSNLAQLYFPDDQKYAIYIPLFLPVGIPVLLSLRSIFALLKNRHKIN